MSDKPGEVSEKRHVQAYDDICNKPITKVRWVECKCVDDCES